MHAVEILMQEHRVIEKALAVLGVMAERIKGGEAVPREKIAALLDFLKVFADRCHHGKEEGALFPRLDENGVPCPGGPLGMMLCEHIRGRSLRRRMEEALSRLNNDEGARQQFLNAACDYIDLLRHHIAKEDKVLFQIARQVLSPDDDASLTGAYERFEREVIGEGVHELYHHLIDELEREFLGESQGGR